MNQWKDVFSNKKKGSVLSKSESVKIYWLSVKIQLF